MIDRLLFEGRAPSDADRALVSWQNLVKQGCFTTESTIAFGPRCGAALGISIERQSLSWAIVADPMAREIRADKEPMPIAPVGAYGEPEPPRLAPDAFVTELREVLARARERTSVSALAGVGVAWPSTISASGQPSYESHHPGFAERDLAADIRGAVEAAGFHARAGEETLLPVSFINDADADLLFEARWGVAAGRRDVLSVKLCGGIGGAVLHNGELMHGAHGRAGEIKHTPVRWESAVRLSARFDNVLDLDALRPCDCGGYDCIGRFASGRAIIDALSDFTDPDYNVRGMEIQAHVGDHSDAERVGRVFNRAGELLGEALIGPVRLLDPDLVVVNAFPRHEKLVKGVAHTLTSGATSLTDDAIVAATPGSHVTAAGAARLVVEEQILPVLEGTDGVAPKEDLPRTDLPAPLRLYLRHWDGADVSGYVRRYRPLRSR